MNYIERALQAIRSTQTADGTVLKDKDLYYDNAYISVYKDHIEATSHSSVEASITGEAMAEASSDDSSMRSANYANLANQAGPSTEPAADPDELISVRYVFEDEDGAPAGPPVEVAEDEPLPGAMGFDPDGIGRLWLVEDEEQAERLNLPPGRWLTRSDLELLAPLTEQERLSVLTYMVHLKGRIRPS
jgi:hypothetical protein